MTADQEADMGNKDFSAGAALQAARKERSYSLAYVAAQTLLHEKVISALEADDYEQLPSPVFVGGYIRTYAKVLEIDPQPLLDDYKKTIPAKPQEVVSQSVKQKSLFQKSNHKQPIISTLLVIAVLLGLTSSWWLQREIEHPVELLSDDVPGIVEDTIEIEAEAEEEYQVGLGEISPDNESSLLPNQQNVSPQVEIEEQASLVDRVLSVAESDDEPEPVISGNVQDPVKITVTFLEESWTEIFDVRKRRLLHGLIKPGAVRVVYGEAPFNIFFGNAHGVEVKINDKPFNHIRYARKNKTARFLVEEGNS